jgi:tetratricopeptide (TPR) repeat protein
MRARPLLFLLMLSLTVSPVHASGGSRPETPASAPPGSVPQAGEQKTPRQQAEVWYTDAYDDVAKAKEVLVAESPDPKKSAKLFKRAIERAARALEYDKTYYEALNLQGFSWRKLGNYEKSLDAYAACLRIEPDYAPAREYYGEALLESGDREGAEGQLVWLKRLRADEFVKPLETALAAVPATDTKAAKSKPTKDKGEGKPASAAAGQTSGN